VPKLVPCTLERTWMGVFTDRHAYRCLPLSIANTMAGKCWCPARSRWNGTAARLEIYLASADKDGWLSDRP
jgi:hypothetical protein